LRAYVLIQKDGNGDHLANELRAIPGVVSAEDVTGAYDAIAVAQSGSMRHMTEVILSEIRKLPGVMRALPAPLLDSSTGARETGPSHVGAPSRDRAA
jgi:DNA-binding Lrp family transcriptional regulator